ncbi:DNA-directed RNA polymerase subunit beta [Cytobacillus firmus]|uniref:DNA-directed RNA polymerase subunit beta n=2 Tax=Cytobacillus TaxID=2675230 RepID=A0A366JYP1_CYTFI|nr:MULTISPECIES: DNA-directed RNA polymerase subunit beta [Cytobacillus]RBP94520.1 DNA-directed RNA polymerase subunit beta [Cytobacillus firmus]TDX43267.1 DNA-directed RNA polymerase subunit beta [Cytobacillus oceanisediminis]
MSVNNSNQEAVKTREQLKKEHSKEESPRKGRVRIRLIPIWLRIIIVVLLIFLSVTAGAAVGYGVIGGGEVKDIFTKSTWMHIVELIEKE